MSNDFSPIEQSDDEGPMFAPIPTWERGRKRRGLGGRPNPAAPMAAAEPRSFTAETPLAPAAEAAADASAYPSRMDTVDPTDTTFAGTPSYAASTRRRGNGAGPLLVAAAVILVGGLAAAGWYATRSHNTGVAELTPGSTTTSTSQVASTAPAGDQLAAPPAATQPEASTRTTTTRTETSRAAPSRVASRAPRAAVSHSRSVRASQAEDVGADAAASAPVRAAPPPPMPTPAAPAPTAAPPASTSTTTSSPPMLNVPPVQTPPPSI